MTEDSKYDIFVGDLSGDKVSNGGSASDWAIYSGFARATYNYDGVSRKKNSGLY